MADAMEDACGVWAVDETPEFLLVGLKVEDYFPDLLHFAGSEEMREELVGSKGLVS